MWELFYFQANCEMNEVPVFNIEPVWQMVRGPSSLVEQAVEQKMTNYGLLTHHYNLAVIMCAVLTFGMKSAKILSLFDSKVCQKKSGCLLQMIRYTFISLSPANKLEEFIGIGDSVCLCSCVLVATF